MFLTIMVSMSCAAALVAPPRLQAGVATPPGIASSRRLSTHRLAAPRDDDDDVARGLWEAVKKNGPAIVTGAWDESAGDESAIGALLNMCFIRIPCLVALVTYTKYVASGADLVVDFGFGLPQPVPPGAVWTIFGILLLPIL